eukprot:scaffold309677_cov21-Tisochrysis_lutea.AAC.2
MAGSGWKFLRVRNHEALIRLAIHHEQLIEALPERAPLNYSQGATDCFTARGMRRAHTPSACYLACIQLKKVHAQSLQVKQIARRSSTQQHAALTSPQGMARLCLSPSTTKNGSAQLARQEIRAEMNKDRLMQGGTAG